LILPHIRENIAPQNGFFALQSCDYRIFSAGGLEIAQTEL
jgi:hypothetical protein